MKKIAVLSFALFVLAACSGEDNSTIDPVTPPSSGTTFGTAEHPLNIGGATQSNQVYVDLSGESASAVPRDSWDLGFYCGNDFRVVINGAIAMAVKQLETSDITAIQTADASVAVGTFQAENMEYVDNPNGDSNDTAFGTIATGETSAKVYLVNLGLNVPTEKPAAGSTNVAGTPRGWKKVKVWQDVNGYTVQYANLEETAPTTVSVTKDDSYNFIFFNLNSGTAVQAEPLKDNWDLNFTTFTNEVFDGTTSAGAYFYADFVVTNTKSGVRAVKVDGDAADYATFNLQTLNAGSYNFSTDQRAIGPDWRDVFTKVVYDNRFFLVKDGAGNVYKLRFISMVSTSGERGFPVFEYELLR